MPRLTTTLILLLVVACGESKQDTGLDEDTAACESDVEIVTVCEDDFTVDWSSAGYTVTSVEILGLKITAVEMKEALCTGSVVQADIKSTITLSPEGGATELLVDALDVPAAVSLYESEEAVATLLVDPDAEESNCTVVFD